MESTVTHPDDEILDLAILWAPIGGPTPDRIEDLFHIGVDDYRRRLLTAIRLHRRRIPARTRADLEHVYGSSILARLEKSQTGAHTPSLDDCRAPSIVSSSMATRL